MRNTTGNNILMHITGKQTPEDVPVDELIEITRQYPAFGAAKYLLAKKTQTENDALAGKYAQSAVLHFPNPHWFHFKLNEEQLMVEGMPATPQVTVHDKVPELIEEQPVITNSVPFDIEKAIASLQYQPPPAAENILPGAEAETVAPDAVTVAEEENETAETVAPGWQNEDAGPVAKQAEVNEEEQEERIIITTQEPVAEELLPAVLVNEEYPVELPEAIPVVEPVLPGETAEQEPVTGEQHADTAVQGEQYTAEGLAVTANEQPVSTELLPVPITELPAAEPAEEYVAEPLTISQAIAKDEHPAEDIHLREPLSEETEEQRDADDTDGFEDADAEIEAAGPVMGNEKISSVLDEQLAEFKKPVADNTPVPIETEPYHTIDYFASQGIKLSLELQKQDHLAVKVKKFTDWLKQMKRISPTPADLGIDEATEHKVQDSAAVSNELKEVVTEAMAEVFAMQGMTEKAIQVYIKLSFLDPSKTAYFATKIEKLKGI